MVEDESEVKELDERAFLDQISELSSSYYHAEKAMRRKILQMKVSSKSSLTVPFWPGPIEVVPRNETPTKSMPDFGRKKRALTTTKRSRPTACVKFPPRGKQSPPNSHRTPLLRQQPFVPRGGENR